MSKVQSLKTDRRSMTEHIFFKDDQKFGTNQAAGKEAQVKFITLDWSSVTNQDFLYFIA
jgi:hypothetical protein